MKQAPTWDELLKMLNDSEVRPDEKGWGIYRYLAVSIGDDLSSEEARTLLMIYMKLRLERPSLLHSMMLAVALRMVETYADFRLPGFLKMWDVATLRTEDFQRQKSEGGRVFPSLVEKLVKAVMRYRLGHPAEELDPCTEALVSRESAQAGLLPAVSMAAVKMFEAMSNGRKMRFVKLVGPKGEEISADWHLFHAKPWEIVGHLYEVLPRRAAETGNLRADTIARSSRGFAEVFGQTVGYVDRFDEGHSHYHIFDAESRHFVAESPAVRPNVGGYVWFSPVVPAKDKFKSAIVLRCENAIDGRQAFGITTARVSTINREKEYFAYQTADGRRGFANLSLSPRPLAAGDEVRLIVFLKRGKDGEKRLHVAEMI